MHPRGGARYAGFIAWRGTLPEEGLPEPSGAFPDGDAVSVGFPGGHMPDTFVQPIYDMVAPSYTLGR